MKNCFVIIFSYFLISCSTQKIQIKVSENLVVNDIASKQLSIINRANKNDLDKILIDSIYKPHSTFWSGYLGDENEFKKWFNEKGKKQIDIWNKNSQTISPSDLTLQLNKTALEMYKFTGYLSKGEWNIVYGPAWTDLGGFSDGTMLIDLAHKANDDFKRITDLYPHEINHQIYSYTQSNTNNTVLNRIIDEGFATYVSYIFHNKKNSIADELMFSEEEYKFCKKNESELLVLLGEHYNKVDEDLSRKFADRNYKFRENYPGAIGYYLGFRIIEEFVKQNGKNSWKKIYKMNPTQVLYQSKLVNK